MMKNYLTVVATILVAIFWIYKAAYAADYSYSQYQAPPPVVYYQPAPPPVVAVPDEDEDNIGTGCRPGCKCEFDALGKPEIDCTQE